MILILYILFFVFVSIVESACPNNCNGHGDCGASSRCTCYNNWQGADCSERLCPFGLAWVDVPTDSNTAHAYAECSNAGICDRSTGLCNCYNGYTGKGCKRSTCPNNCSGHGTCYFINEISEQGSQNLNNNWQINWGENFGGAAGMFLYTNWDTNKIQACVCDPNYTGTDCSLKQCPRGDNILTLDSSISATQSFSLTASNSSPTGQITITFMDLYGAIWTTRPIDIGIENTSADITGALNIQNALISLPNAAIPSVSVTAYYSTFTNSYTISFVDDANTGNQNLITVNWKGCTRAGCAPFFNGLVDPVNPTFAIHFSSVTQSLPSSPVMIVSPLVTSPSDLPAGSGLFGLFGIAVDIYNTIYVSEHFPMIVYKISTNGQITQLNSPVGGWGFPDSVAVDLQLNVYVADSSLNNFYAVSSMGLVSTINVPFTLYGASCIAVDSQQNLYVTNGAYPQSYGFPLTIYRLPSSDYYQAVRLNSPNNGWVNIYAMAIDSQFNVYVADLGLPGIYKILTNGNVFQLMNSEEVGYPTGVAVDSNFNVYVTSSTKFAVYMITPDGIVTSLFSPSMGLPTDVAVDSQFNVYFTNYFDFEGVYKLVSLSPNSNDKVKENAICSEHGTCDSVSGQCKCFSGFYGNQCYEQTILL